jgi:hypothetical protein
MLHVAILNGASRHLQSQSYTMASLKNLNFTISKRNVMILEAKERGHGILHL